MTEDSLEKLIVHITQEFAKAAEEEEGPSIERLKAVSDMISAAMNDAKAGDPQVSTTVQEVSFDDLQKRFDAFKAEMDPTPPRVAKDQAGWPRDLAKRDNLDLEGGRIPDPPPVWGWDPPEVAAAIHDPEK